MGSRVGADGRRARVEVRDLPWPAMWSAILAVLLLGGALGNGYVLSYDMVWVPDLAIRGDFFGLGSSLPRAVPSDLVVALLDNVVPGMLLQKTVLLGSLVVAGVGAARLVPGPGTLGRLAAATCYVWNPFVVERLGIGHWPLLITYACLPWIHLCARRLAADGRGLPQMVLWLGLASLSPVGGLVAGALALVGVSVSVRSARRATMWTLGAVLALNAPWAVAGVLHGAGSVSDSSAVTAFSAQGEGALPAWAAVLGLGGIWNAEVVPLSRTTWASVVALVVVLAACVAGAAPWRGRTSRADRLALTIPAVLGLVIALAGATAPGAVGWLVAHVPGAGLVRDGTRFAALLAPVQAMLFGLGVGRVAAAMGDRRVGLALGTVLVLGPVTLMPDASWGLSGRLGAVDFPGEYAVARAALEASRTGGQVGDVLVLPFTSYRRPAWNDGRRTLDPLGRYLPADYLASDTLVVSGQSIAGEDLRARRVAAHLETLDGAALERALAEEGIGWVVLDTEASRALLAEGVDDARYGTDPVLGDARVLHQGDALTLWALPQEDGAPAGRRLGAVRLLVLGMGWGAAGAALAGAALVLANRRWNTWRQLRRSG